MTRAQQIRWASSWEEAQAAAVRLHQITKAKGMNQGEGYRYRVRKRRVGRYDLWRVYTPSGSIPDRRRAGA